MAVPKGFVVALALTLCLLHCVEAQNSCEPPLLGEWVIAHNWPTHDHPGEFFKAAETYFILENPVEGMYNGTGGGHVISFVPGLTFPFYEYGPEGKMSFLAFFDPVNCVLSGAAMYFQIDGADVFVWEVSDSKTMSGNYMATNVDGALLFDTLGRHDVTFVEQK